MKYKTKEMYSYRNAFNNNFYVTLNDKMLNET